MARGSTTEAMEHPTGLPELRMLPITQVVPHPRNVRRDVGDVTELADSVLAHGVLEPLLVVPISSVGDDYLRAAAARGDAEETFVVVAGHRRLAAAQVAMVDELPCLIRRDLADDTAVTLAMLVENLQRTDLTPIEEADAYHQLELAGMTVTAIVKATGRSRSTVDSRLKLLTLPDAVKDRVHNHQLSLDEAAALGEFTGNWDAMSRLEAVLGTHNWSYELQSQRRAAKRAADLAAVRERLEARSIRLFKPTCAMWEMDRKHPEVCNLDVLGFEPVWVDGRVPDDEDDEPRPWDADISWPAHEACPGHAAIVQTAEDVKWVCTTSGVHPGGQKSPSADEAAAGGHSVHAVSKADQERQEKADQETAALLAARDVRIAFLRPLVCPGKPLSKYQTIAIATYLVEALPHVEFTPNGEEILDVLGVDYQDRDLDTLDDHATHLLAELDPNRALLALIGAAEESSTKHGWQWTGAYYFPDRRRWFRLLESIGYQPSDFELSLLADPATGSESGDEPDEDERPIQDVPTGDLL